jgi:putative protease
MRERRYAQRENSVLNPIEETEDSNQDGYTYPNFNVHVHTLEQLRTVVDEGGVNLFVSTLEMLKNALELKKSNEFKVYFAPGRIVRDFEFEQFDANLEIIQRADGIWAGTYGMLQWAAVNKLQVAGIGQGLNVFNRSSVKAHCKAGYISTLSPEMTLAQIKAIDSGACGLEAMVYGRQTVMVTEYCPISAALSNGKVGCGLCEKNQYGLQDKKGAIFPVMRSNQQCRTQVLNSKILFVPEDLDTLYDEGVRNYRMVFTLENAEAVKSALLYFKRAMDHELTQEDEAVKARFVSMGLTRGHYHRGVFTEE